MVWEPQKGPQTSALLADWCPEIFYGGERGGGKSDFQLGYQEDAALRYDGKSRGIVFRKTYPEIEELQARAMQIYPLSGGIYKTQPSAQYPYSNCWYWRNGATIKMRFIESEQDYGKYHGHQYTHISFDEVTEYASPIGLLKMLSTLRSSHGVPCTMRATGNPGGVGHGWVKRRYIDPSAPYTPFIDEDTGLVRMFIPSRTADNAILLDNDPAYRNRIKAATQGNEALRRAWLDGDWDIVAGAFFDCWDRNRHVIRPFTIPSHWLRFRSGDWGSARPFSFGWWAIVSEETKINDSLILPRGAMVRYREWYGIKTDDSGQILHNTGIKETAENVGIGIAEREKNDGKIVYGVLDPAAFSQDGGPSIAERIYSGSQKRVMFRRADNARVSGKGALGGWDQMRNRLIGEAENRPMVVCFDTCTDSIRTIPLLQHDSDRVEDVDTDMEDHAGDDWRYACMSRPWAKPELQTPENMHNIEQLQFSDLLKVIQKRKRDNG